MRMPQDPPEYERLSLSVPPAFKHLVQEMAEERGATITSTVMTSVRLRRYLDEREAEGWRPALVKGDAVREIVLP